MRLLTTCQEFCPDNIPVQTDSFLNRGVDGEVYSIINDPNKVIKFGVSYDYQSLLKVLSFICLNKPPAYVRVYEYGCIREIEDGIIYYCIMEKLLEISDDEKRIFHSIVSHEDFGKKKDLSATKVEELISGMSALDFDAEKVRLFCRNIRAVPLLHNDMHIRNIMKNDSGNFKLVDLDRIQMENDNGKE